MSRDQIYDIKKQLENSFSLGEGTLHLNEGMSDKKIITLVRGCMKMSQGRPFTVLSENDAGANPQLKQVNK